MIDEVEGLWPQPRAVPLVGAKQQGFSYFPN